MPESKSEMASSLQGSMKAVSKSAAHGEPKIGVDEFMAIARRFGFSPDALAKMRAIAGEEDLGEGPFLANYYSNLPETCVQAFEREARELFGVKHALAVSSGTAALHCAFIAAGVGPGREVICPAIGFYATAAAVVQSNGIPVFCDVDESLGMDATKLEQLITPRTVAIAPTHVMGSVTNLAPITEIARKHGLKVIEDCAQSCGASYRGQLVGTIGDIGCFSISAYKIVGGGEAGLLLTNDDALWARANQQAECGGLWRPVRFAPPRWDGELFNGTNYRLSELEAAVDTVQMGKVLPTQQRFNHVKHSILSKLAAYAEIVPQKLNDSAGEVGYLLRFCPQTGDLARQIVKDLQARGVKAGCRPADAPPDWHISAYMYPITEMRGPTEDNCPFRCPIYLERGGQAHYAVSDCPVSVDLFERVVSISLNQWYSDEDCANLASAISEVLSLHCHQDDNAARWL
ncbi:MAG: DegT/DnrJ/EryC1/StrS family aminotransferase [Anaerolineae bacterium]